MSADKAFIDTNVFIYYQRSDLELYNKLSISYFDALMVAAALEANCKYLISEDMQDGLIIDNKLQIVNIYEHANLLTR
jgi:predicted nucleic acid-binding protein